MQRGEWIHLERDEHVVQEVAKLLLVTAYTAGLDSLKVCPHQQYAAHILLCLLESRPSCAIFCFVLVPPFKIKKPCKEKKHRRYRGRLSLPPL